HPLRLADLVVGDGLEGAAGGAHDVVEMRVRVHGAAAQDRLRDADRLRHDVLRPGDARAGVPTVDHGCAGALLDAGEARQAVDEAETVELLGPTPRAV